MRDLEVRPAGEIRLSSDNAREIIRAAKIYAEEHGSPDADNPQALDIEVP